MDWQIISTVAEAIGAAGVIITLVYLARQIREANQNAAIEANERLARDYASHGSVVMSDENVDVFVRGLASSTQFLFGLDKALSSKRETYTSAAW